jgi:hypothetical protein
MQIKNFDISVDCGIWVVKQKHWILSARLHGVTTQTTVDIFTAVRISNFNMSFWIGLLKE